MRNLVPNDAPNVRLSMVFMRIRSLLQGALLKGCNSKK